MKYRIIIAGGRDFNDLSRVAALMAKVIAKIGYDNIDCVISGMARGADITGWRVAKNLNLPIVEMKPDWSTHGKRGGMLRNIDMANYSQSDGCIGVLLAFHDGVSRGTKHMIEYSNKVGLDVRVYPY